MLLVLCRGWNELLGILVGHVFFFLMYKYPQDFGGAQFISTPQILWEHGSHCNSMSLFEIRETRVSVLWHLYRVRTDPGEVWKVVKFKVEIFHAMKSLENDLRYGKVFKNPWKLWGEPGKLRFSLHCWLLQHMFVTLLAFDEIQSLSLSLFITQSCCRVFLIRVLFCWHIGMCAGVDNDMSQTHIRLPYITDYVRATRQNRK